MKYTIHPFVQNVIDSKDLHVADSSEMENLKTFRDYIVKRRQHFFLDWSDIPNVMKLDLAVATDEDVVAFIESSVVSQYEHVAVLNSAILKDLVLIASKSVLREDFNALIIRGPLQYIVGLNENGQQLFPVVEDFLESRMDHEFWLIGQRKS